MPVHALLRVVRDALRLVTERRSPGSQSLPMRRSPEIHHGRLRNAGRLVDRAGPVLTVGRHRCACSAEQDQRVDGMPANLYLEVKVRPG